MGLERKMDVIFGWMDNLDLQIFTPDGRRAHTRWHTNSSNLIRVVSRPSVSPLSRPRLQKVDTVRSTPEVCDAGLALLHYTGKKQVNPPENATCIACCYIENPRFLPLH